MIAPPGSTPVTVVPESEGEQPTVLTVAEVAAAAAPPVAPLSSTAALRAGPRGSRDVLPGDPPTVAQPAIAATRSADGAGPVVSPSARRAERAVAALSAVLGTLGILLGVGLALLHAYAYGDPASCAAAAARAPGSVGFGCTPAGRQAAIALPANGLPLLVVGALALVWVPEHSTERRAVLLGGFALALLAVIGLAALAFSALPATR